MPILNYTTKVSADKTASEIVTMLGRKGADEVHQQFSNGLIAGISFVFKVAGDPVKFYLPVNVDGVHEHLMATRPRAAADRKQSERVAWRIVKDWIEVQVALVESRQAEMAQVFMPYAMLSDGQTMYKAFQSHRNRLALSVSAQSLALGSGDED